MNFLQNLRRACGALVVVAALAGCGGGDASSVIDTDAAGGGDVADTTAAAAPGDVLFGDEFGQVCRGTGQALASEYSSGPGLHPLFQVQSDGDNEFQQSYGSFPDGWSVNYPDLDRTELVLCIVRTSTTPVEVCEGYVDDDSDLEWSVQTHDATYEYTLRVAKSAEALATEIFVVPSTGCPMFSSYTEGDPQPVPNYPRVGDGDAELFVKPFVSGA